MVSDSKNSTSSYSLNSTSNALRVTNREREQKVKLIRDRIKKTKEINDFIKTENEILSSPMIKSVTFSHGEKS
jgi:hypothetical protein